LNHISTVCTRRKGYRPKGKSSERGGETREITRRAWISNHRWAQKIGGEEDGKGNPAKDPY